MRCRNRYLIAGLVIAGLGLTGCGSSPVSSADTSDSAEPGPAVVEPVEGTELSRITLTEMAAHRLGITTVPVGQTAVRTGQAGTAPGGTVIPYTALLYDPEGVTWVYTNPEPLVYLRHEVTVAQIAGDQAVLTQGPPAGTAVVTVGAAELYGAELGVGQ